MLPSVLAQAQMCAATSTERASPPSTQDDAPPRWRCTRACAASSRARGLRNTLGLRCRCQLTTCDPPDRDASAPALATDGAGASLTLPSVGRAAWRRPRHRFSAVRWRVTALGRGGAPTSPLPADRPARRPASAPSRRSASRSRPPSRADAQRACATRAGATKLRSDGLARAASVCGGKSSAVTLLVNRHAAHKGAPWVALHVW